MHLTLSPFDSVKVPLQIGILDSLSLGLSWYLDNIRLGYCVTGSYIRWKCFNLKQMKEDYSIYNPAALTIMEERKELYEEEFSILYKQYARR